MNETNWGYDMPEWWWNLYGHTTRIWWGVCGNETRADLIRGHEEQGCGKRDIRR